MFVLFNEENKFVVYSEDFPNLPNLKIKKKSIPESQRDLNFWRWQGDFETGSMVNINDHPYPTDDIDLKHELYDKIYNEYPIDVQNVIIIKQLQALAYKNQCLIPEFATMSNLILKAVENYKHDYKFYLNKNE